MGIIHPANLAEVLAYAIPVVGLMRRNGGSGRRPPARPPAAPAAATASGGAAPASTPLTIITSVSVTQWVRGDLGITIGTGVSAWADQSASAKNFTQATGGAQPTYTASDATLNNQSTLTCDGVAQFMTSTLARAAPATTSLWMSAIVKQIASTSTHQLFGDATGGRFVVRQTASSPNLLSFMNVSGNTNAGLAIGSWGRLETGFTNSTSDYLKLKATNATGTSAGSPGAGTGTRFGVDSGGTLFANFAIAELIICAGLPSGAEITAIDAYYTARYGAGLV